MVSEFDKCNCQGSTPQKTDCGSKKDDSKCCGQSKSSPQKEEKPKCGGASACAQSQKKKEDPCSGKSKLKSKCPEKVDKGQNKSGCPQAGKRSCKEVKGKCHSSHEQFKGKDKCSAAGESKCNDSYKSFVESRVEMTSCGADKSEENKCHESRKEFFKNRKSEEEKCNASHKAFHSKKDSDKGPCSLGTVSKPKESPCSSSMKTTASKSPCNLAYDKQQQKDGPCSSSTKTYSSPKPREEKQTPCYSPPKHIRTEKPCSSESRAVEEPSTYSKISGFCKKLAKQYVKPKPKSKCSADVENIDKQICRKSASGLPPIQPPCAPITEIGVPTKVKVECISKVTCPQLKKPNSSDFFSLDVRNKKLNDCVEKWAKIDPSQVISKCSKLSNSTSALSDKCLETVKKSQQQCLKVVEKASGASKKSFLTVPLKSRQLASRWAPSAAAYLAASALFTVYATEWKAVLRYVPMYSSIVREED